MDRLPAPDDPPPRRRTGLVSEIGILFLGACVASLVFWVLAGVSGPFGWFAAAYFAAFLVCDVIRMAG